MSDINLIPKLYREDKKSFKVSRGAILSVGLILILCIYGVGYYLIQKEYDVFKKEEMTLNVKISKYKEINEVKDRLDFKMVKLKKMTDLLEASYKISKHNTYIFSSILEYLPQGIYIRDYSIDPNDSIKIVARTFNSADISYFIYSLKQSGKFTDVKVSSITLNKSQTKEEDTPNFSDYTFNLEMKYVK